MRKYLLFLIPVIFVTCSTCKVTKCQIKEIQFGGGGGIAGIYSSNKVLRNGNVYKGDIVITKLSRKETYDLFTLAESIEANKNMPGNVSCYIHIIRKDTVLRKVWDWQTTPDSITLELYHKLNSYIQ